MNSYQSWGGYPSASDQEIVKLRSTSEPLPVSGRSLLPRGLGRTYGDVCLNNGGRLLLTNTLNQVMDFDEQKGVLRAEGGVSLWQIVERVLPHGWFLPVTPGTSRVTLGGAIANDVHGKNHHHAGTFGRFVLRFELLRSDGNRLVCSPTENAEWFCATIGGLGLTGLITWAEIQLKSIKGPLISQETIPFSSLADFMRLTRESEKDFEYTVAWLDTTAKGEGFGRGIFFRGNHADVPARNASMPHPVSVPCYAPSWLLNKASITAFNSLYFYKQRLGAGTRLVSPAAFFYPLDNLEHWNRLYGKKGFVQYQFVVPPEDGERATAEILQMAQCQGLISFLTVLKQFGDVPSPGLLSFPRAGLTLAMDFSFRDEKTLRGLAALDDILRRYGGRLYPAKDARMSGSDFKAMYPQWEEFERFIDPHFSSQFWRRVMENVS